MGNRADWEELKPLGEGGQSTVTLVRRPTRVNERKKSLEEILKFEPWKGLSGDVDPKEPAKRFAEALWAYARPESPSELGAMKTFKIPAEGPKAEEAVRRLENEVAVLKHARPGLLKLLDSNEAERWIVTEYHPEGTLADKPYRYKGNVGDALKAFRSLVEAVASLHRDKIVHRDIKPHNVFIGIDGELVLGDFGIVFLPTEAERLTKTMERVGPRDYMPQWADLGERLEKVEPNFDVYMLGKVLWCMVTGHLKLPREYYRRQEFNVVELFSNDPDMHIINAILDPCIAEDPKQCLPSAQELLGLVDEHLGVVYRGGQVLAEGVERLCRICGRGKYHAESLPAGTVGKPIVHLNMAGMPIGVRVFVCDHCRHVEFFRSE